MSAFVYRVFGNSGELLYVGCTNDVQTRLRYHRYRTPWFRGEAARIDSEEFPTREQALTAERAAIVLEQPVYNRTHRHWLPVQVEALHRVVVTDERPLGLPGQTARSAARSA